MHSFISFLCINVLTSSKLINNISIVLEQIKYSKTKTPS